jgi:WD40 repeat protein
MRICCDPNTGKGCNALNSDQARHCKECKMSLEQAPRLFNPGDRIRHYRIVSIIGYGKFGAVYEAQAILDPSVTVALKEKLHANSTSLFRREFEALRQIQHPNLPRYYGSFVERSRGYLVMDLVQGQSLHEVLKKRTKLPDGRREPLPEPLVIGCYAVQLCEALRYLHGQETPILHRDIKPDNIRVTPDGLIKLVDFGLLKYAGDKTHPDIRGIGTAPYAPLEQYSTSDVYTDQRSDIYSLSAMLYHLITGKVPPPVVQRLGKSPDPLLPPGYYVPDISPHVSDALMIGMNLSKQDRYADITMFKRALLDDSTVNLPRTLRGHSGQVTSISYSPDGQLLASASSDWTVRVWNAPEGRLRHTLRGHSGPVLSVACSPDGQLLASGSSGSVVRLWDVQNGSSVGAFEGHSSSVRSVAWKPDGQLLASAGDDRMVHIWRMAEGRLWYTLRGHTESVYDVVWSPDGQLLASGGKDRTVRIWKIASGTVLDILEGHTAEVRALVWSPDGSTFASASADGTIRLWRAQDLRLLHILRGHTSKVNSLAYSPNGLTLASASTDQTVRLWRVRDGNLLHILSGHVGIINDLAYNPDGRTLVVGGEDKTIREWMAISFPRYVRQREKAV